MIIFGSSLITVAMRWPDLKAVVASKGLLLQYVESEDSIQAFAVDASVVYTCDIFYAGSLYATDEYTQAQIDADRTDFQANFAASANRPLEPRTTDGKVRMSAEKTTVSRATFYSFNWADKTTWYSGAARQVAEAASYVANSGTPYWQLAHTGLIDTFHGKITQEDYLRDAQGNSYRVAVTLNGAVQHEQDPHAGAGGDFVVDYDLGRVSPVVPGAWAQADAVLVTYQYAVSSLFLIKPTPGKRLIINLVEVNFSGDVSLTDSVVFQAKGRVEAFAPQLLQSNGGPYPAGTLIPLGSPARYKTMQDYLNDSMRSYPSYPALGGAGWRGTQQPSYVFDWDYVSGTELLSSKGMQISLALEHDVPFRGSFATATFYCTSQDE